MSRWLRAWALPVVAVASTMTACSTGNGSGSQADPTPVLHSPSTSPTRTIPPKPPPPPGPHVCYQLAYDDALAPTNDQKPVPCNGRHTAITFFVGHFPPRARRRRRPGPQDRGDRLPAPVRVVRRRVDRGPPAEHAPDGVVHPDRRRARRWGRTGSSASRSPSSGDQELAPLAGPVQGALDRTEARDRYALCGTAEPGTAGFEQRMCALSHSWRALRTVPFPAGPLPRCGQGQGRRPDALPGRRPRGRQ